jgi:deoxyribodipyrimidine photo-lyase
MKEAIAVWFRTDLRVSDHAMLVEAAARAQARNASLHCVYCLDLRDFGPSEHLGLPRVGPFRARFLLESLEALDASLRKLGSALLIRRGAPEEVLGELAAEAQWTDLYFHRLVGTEEKRTERRVLRAMKSRGVEVHGWMQRTLHDEYPFEIADTPAVFSSFRKIVEREVEFAAPVPAPSDLPGPGDIDRGTRLTLEELGVEDIQPDERAALRFDGGEPGALRRLGDFIDGGHLATYKETRNGLVGADYSSKLSPWLALGCISCRTIQAAVADYETAHGANDSTYWMSFELLWRDYFTLILAKHGGEVFRPEGLQGIPVPWGRDPEAFEAWRTGRTGFPFVDANMRELLLTGFMSNRGRQNVGSFLTKNLGIDWRLGAEWFEIQLVDYDVASNYGNWNYTAGVGNDARGFRYFNIPKQASMYDGEGLHAKLWLPEIDRADVRLGEDYPHPIVDLETSQRTQRAAWEAAMAKHKARKRS